jgi:hypothetical protein
LARRFEVDKINLDAYEIKPFINEKYIGFVIKWDSDIGFGEYTIYKANGSDKWLADSEHMDNKDDKAFLNELLKQFVTSLDIID